MLKIVDPDGLFLQTPIGGFYLNQLSSLSCYFVEISLFPNIRYCIRTYLLYGTAYYTFLGEWLVVEELEQALATQEAREKEFEGYEGQHHPIGIRYNGSLSKYPI